MNKAKYQGPWRVFENALSDGSFVYHLRYHIEGNRYAREVYLDCEDENAAYKAADVMNAIIKDL